MPSNTLHNLSFEWSQPVTKAIIIKTFYMYYDKVGFCIDGRKKYKSLRIKQGNCFTDESVGVVERKLVSSVNEKKKKTKSY